MKGVVGLNLHKDLLNIQNGSVSLNHLNLFNVQRLTLVQHCQQWRHWRTCGCTCHCACSAQVHAQAIAHALSARSAKSVNDPIKA
jgi:hypothetical protein